jgi:hypothetical protein
MGLDVHLEGPAQEVTETCPCCQHTATVWRSEDLYSMSITHNLGLMAQEAGIYEILWRPEEVGVRLAKDLVEPLRQGLKLLLSDPERFRKFDPPSGWGTYEDLLVQGSGYLLALKRHPEATIRVSR